MTSQEKDLIFSMHTALMMSVKERIKEIEEQIQIAQTFTHKQTLMEAKVHNEKILIGLIASTMSMTPPSKEFH